MAAKGRFKVEWHGAEVLKAMREVTEEEQKAAAKRIEKRLQKYVPVRKEPYPPSKRSASGWKRRQRGLLRSTIRTAKSKFKDGGYVVFVGSQQAYYAYWVEAGTVFTYRQKYGRRGEKYMRRAANLERARFIRQIKKRVGAA